MEFRNEKLEEFEQKLDNMKVAVIGIGVSNIPLIDYLYSKKAKVTIFDEKEKIDEEIMRKINQYGFKYSLGKDNLSQLKGFDLIFRSPSCLPTKPELQAEKQRGAIVTTEIEQLMKMAPCKIIGITGSDGKTTTTTLTYEILKDAGYTTHLGGNIGIPLFTKLSEIKPEDIIVLELSSFQLMEMEVSPEIATITNITPNHLNIHKDYQEYIECKKNIFKHQNENGILVLNADNEITYSSRREANGRVILFSSKQKLENGFIYDEHFKASNDLHDNVLVYEGLIRELQNLSDEKDALINKIITFSSRIVDSDFSEFIKKPFVEKINIFFRKNNKKLLYNLFSELSMIEGVLGFYRYLAGSQAIIKIENCFKKYFESEYGSDETYVDVTEFIRNFVADVIDFYNDRIKQLDDEIVEKQREINIKSESIKQMTSFVKKGAKLQKDIFELNNDGKTYKIAGLTDEESLRVYLDMKEYLVTHANEILEKVENDFGYLLKR